MSLSSDQYIPLMWLMGAIAQNNFTWQMSVVQYNLVYFILRKLSYSFCD